ncbi:lipocalin family protein [Flavobacterium sp. RHBU_24]|uniref:lipocalin family protein n=1 Tax=Flavobacterium sp. RHBU_24 TaxID=3391185 RepID=UPI0039855F11
MKKILGLAMAAALLMSCSDDDKGSSVDMSKLTAGKWYYSSSKTVAAGQELSNEVYDHDCATSKDYVTYTAGVYTDVYHYSDCEADSDVGTYTVSGNTVTTVLDGTTDVATVETLDASTLVLKYQETLNGVTFTTTDTYKSN